LLLSLLLLLLLLLLPDKRQLYEFVVRHFLASCSKDAVAFETTVTIDIAGEAFRTTGARQAVQVAALVVPDSPRATYTHTHQGSMCTSTYEQWTSQTQLLWSSDSHSANTPQQHSSPLQA
jgi:hypothetical protein